MGQLKSLEDLRRVIAEPRATTKSKILDALDEQSIAFLARCPFALVGTTAPDGTIEVSPKGDDPGFIRVEDPRTLLIPERVGNNLAFGLSNMITNGKVLDTWTQIHHFSRSLMTQYHRHLPRTVPIYHREV